MAEETNFPSTTIILSVKASTAFPLFLLPFLLPAYKAICIYLPPAPRLQLLLIASPWQLGKLWHTCALLAARPHCTLGYLQILVGDHIISLCIPILTFVPLSFLPEAPVLCPLSLLLPINLSNLPLFFGYIYYVFSSLISCPPILSTACVLCWLCITECVRQKIFLLTSPLL